MAAGSPLYWDQSMRFIDYNPAGPSTQGPPMPKVSEAIFPIEFRPSDWPNTGIKYGGLFKMKLPFWKKLEWERDLKELKVLSWGSPAYRNMMTHGGIIWLPKRYGSSKIKAQLEKQFSHSPVQILHCHRNIYGYRVAYGND